MLTYLARRVLIMIPTLFVISLVSFFIIQLPPGDFLTSYVANLAQTGEQVDEAQIAALRARYGLDQPFYVQYGKWMSGVLVGDFGRSFAQNRPVSELIWERLWLTVALALVTVIVTWLVAVPMGIYSATHQYSLWDNIFAFVGFIGMSFPSFSLALILLYFSYTWFGTSAGGAVLAGLHGCAVVGAQGTRFPKAHLGSRGDTCSGRHGGPNAGDPRQSA